MYQAHLRKKNSTVQSFCPRNTSTDRPYKSSKPSVQMLCESDSHWREVAPCWVFFVILLLFSCACTSLKPPNPDDSCSFWVNTPYYWLHSQLLTTHYYQDQWQMKGGGICTIRGGRGIGLSFIKEGEETEWFGGRKLQTMLHSCRVLTQDVMWFWSHYHSLWITPNNI